MPYRKPPSKSEMNAFKKAQKDNQKDQKKVKKIRDAFRKKHDYYATGAKAKAEAEMEAEMKKKTAPKKKPPAPKKKGGVVSFAFLKELSQKKGFDFRADLAFDSLKVGKKMRLDFEDGSKVVELVSTDEKGLTFDVYDSEKKVTQLHDGPNTKENPSKYVQTILGDKQKKGLKLTWGQFYETRRTAKSVRNIVEINTGPYKRKTESKKPAGFLAGPKLPPRNDGGRGGDGKTLSKKAKTEMSLIEEYMRVTGKVPTPTDKGYLKWKSQKK